MRCWMSCCAWLAVLAPGPVASQATDKGRPADVRGVMVDGWTGRLDAKAEGAGRTLADTKVWSSNDTLHVEGGPASIFWHPSFMASGRFTVSAVFVAPASPSDDETYGVFMGGSELDGRVPNHLYCVLHGQGMFSVKHRFGGETHSLVERRSSGAIRPPDAAGRVTNQIAWRVDDGAAACVVNGTAVATFPRAILIGDGKLASTDGVTGIRVQEGVDVRVIGLRITQP